MLLTTLGVKSWCSVHSLYSVNKAYKDYRGSAAEIARNWFGKYTHTISCWKGQAQRKGVEGRGAGEGAAPAAAQAFGHTGYFLCCTDRLLRAGVFCNLFYMTDGPKTFLIERVFLTGPEKGGNRRGRETEEGRNKSSAGSAGSAQGDTSRSASWKG